jgi:hypothetical protein
VQEKQAEIKKLQKIKILQEQQYERAKKFIKEQKELEILQEVHQ